LKCSSCPCPEICPDIGRCLWDAETTIKVTSQSRNAKCASGTLNARSGSKNDKFFDLKNDVILSQDQFVNQWMAGLKKAALAEDGGSVVWLWKSLKMYPNFRK
jgi:hypothetical protein